MFNVTYTYKVAFLPFPAMFITAFCEVPAIYIKEVSQSIISNLLGILEKAQKEYKAAIIANEPTMQTHNLNLDKTKNAVVVCCSLRFQSLVEMNTFMQKEIKNQQ